MRLVLTFVLIAAISGCGRKDVAIKVVSLNIRYDNPGDGINAWPKRRTMVLDFLQKEQPDLFGLQEVLWHQYTLIDSTLTGYGSVAAGRDDGKESGEMTPLFYSKERFILLESGTFWLSETPDLEGSRGWGAILPRIVTWAHLTEIESGMPVYYFNTHFSHMSDSARVMSSRVLRSEVERIAGDNLFIISGDFNMLPGSLAYSELVAPPVADSYLMSEKKPAGAVYTFNGFSDQEGWGRIDYIFVCEEINVKSHATFALKRDSIFISDHWPVRAVIEIDSDCFPVSPDRQ